MENKNPWNRTLMSSGRPASLRFSCSLFITASSVLSTGGLGALVSVGFFSSWDPKLLGRVLLRWRGMGVKSSSDFSNLWSVKPEHGATCL